MWTPYDNGNTINTIGSESGTIILDEEHPVGARVTLEKNGNTPFGITCGIYGLMVHTTFDSTEQEALNIYSVIKHDMEQFLADESATFEDACEWCAWFVSKY